MIMRAKRGSGFRFVTVVLLLVAACGNYTGYGDFNDVAYEDIDWVEVVTLVVQCTNDNGYAVEQSPTGDGVFLEGIPGQDQKRASEVMDRCREGLNVPDSPEG